jgi:hypothetical protein
MLPTSLKNKSISIPVNLTTSGDAEVVGIVSNYKGPSRKNIFGNQPTSEPINGVFW